MTDFSNTSDTPTQPDKKGGCMKWGGIAAAIVIVLGLVGSCNSASSESDAPVETVTVTATTTKQAETVTQTTTVTTEVEETTEETTEQITQETTSSADVDTYVDPDSSADVDNRQRFANIPDPAPTPAPTPAPAATYYKNCDAVRAAGAAPLYSGSPGYSSKLDRDSDGVACE